MKYANKQFSHGTLNPRHLLVISLDFIKDVADLLSEVKDVLRKAAYLSHADEWHELTEMWMTVFEYLETLAEDGYYFGCTEGDGSDIGWWQVVGED
jgi:hypothetical protein